MNTLFRHLQEKGLYEASGGGGKNGGVKAGKQGKCLLIEKKRMTEAEAHRFIGKQAMDQGLSRRRAAMRLLEELEE